MTDSLIQNPTKKFGWDLCQEYSDSRKTEIFDRYGQTNVLCPHAYIKLNFLEGVVVELLKKRGIPIFGGIRCLAHGEFKIPLDKWIILGAQHPLAYLPSLLRQTIAASEQFAQFESIEEKRIRDEGIRLLGRVCYSFWETALKCVEVYIQQRSTTEMHTAYPHSDKVGNLVCFSLLQGSCYVLLAIPSRTQGAKVYTVRKNKNTYSPYTQWKKKSNEKSQKEIANFELELQKEAKLKYSKHPWNCPFQMKVYQLKAGDSLIFLGKDYIHGSIIPAQRFPRVLAIFHEFIPVL
jgi:hypothetical protein